MTVDMPDIRRMWTSPKLHYSTAQPSTAQHSSAQPSPAQPSPAHQVAQTTKPHLLTNQHVRHNTTGDAVQCELIHKPYNVVCMYTWDWSSELEASGHPGAWREKQSQGMFGNGFHYLSLHAQRVDQVGKDQYPEYLSPYCIVQ